MMSKNLLKVMSIIFSLFFALTSQTLAQFSDWIVTIQTPPGYELYLENLWEIAIINQEEQATEVYLFGEVFEESSGNMFRGRSNLLFIPAGGLIITSNDITDVADKWFEPNFKRAIERHGRFPAGDYNICVTVFNAETHAPLTANCVRTFVSLPSAPRLITPIDESELVERYPLFQWTEPTPFPPEVQVFYHFKICEIYLGQTPQDAINNIAFYENNNYAEMTMLQYPMEAQAFEPNKKYAWQVRAFDEERNSVGENEGKSEIWIFTFKPKLELLSGPIPTPRTVVTTTDDKIYGWRQDKKKPCSLREAIRWAVEHPGPDTIVFKIPENDPGYDKIRKVWIFKFKNNLPILKTNETIIDGTWGQTSIQTNLGCQKPVVELDGTGTNRGILIQGDRNTIKGLSIYKCNGPGIRIEGSANSIICNYIGTNVDQKANIGNVSGVAVRVLGANNKIGKPNAGNLISGNKNNGILIYGKVKNISVSGNFIGVKTDGVTKLPNRTGISIENGAIENKIGAPFGRSKDKCDKGCNVISGNKEYGIRIMESDKNVVSGCFIGVGADGISNVGNGLEGILILGSHNNRIGGGKDDLRNVISGNRTGIMLKRTKNRRSVINKIEGNYIGTDLTGRIAIPNLQRGIYITTKSENNIIGGSYNQGNIIGGNKGAGICIDNNSKGNLIFNNWIGISKPKDTGSNISHEAPAIIANGQGVALYRGANNNIIGGSKEHANIIAYNIGDGIHVEGIMTVNNGLSANSIYNSGGKGISLIAGGNGTEHPWLKIWEERPLGGNKFYVVGQIKPEPKYQDFQVVCYSDEWDEGYSCEASGVKIDPKTGWFSCNATKSGNNRFTFTVSDKKGLNTSEFLLSAKPAHIGTWLFDMDYWEYDQDNICPKNPHHHGGWGNFPPRKQIRAEFKKQAPWYKVAQFKRGFTDIPGVAHNVFATYNWWNTCMYSDGSFAFFMNYATPVLFTGKIYWESYINKGFCFAGDMDNNFGLLTPPGTGVNINTQRYFNHAKTGNDRIDCPETSNCDARKWPEPKWQYIANEFNKHKSWVPLLTLEIDRCSTFENWNSHPFWDPFDGVHGKQGFGAQGVIVDNVFRKYVDDKEAIVFGIWTMDCAHECRSEVHPVLGLAIQDEPPDKGQIGREIWHFFARNRGNQAYCGEQVSIGSTHPDWYFRFKGRPGLCKIKGTNGYAHEENDDTVYWKIYRSGNDVVVKIHLPDEDDWLIGTVTIDWQ